MQGASGLGRLDQTFPVSHESSEGDWIMRTLLGVPIAAVLLAAAAASTAHASCCGAASYKNVGCSEPCGYAPAKQHCYTVMKTCREVVYDKQEYTCYKKVHETVYDTRTVECCKMVPETHY